MGKNLKEADRHAKALKSRLTKALADPAAHDPVYQACQRIFHKTDPLTLTRDDPTRKHIRTRAWRRFIHGCPPRKKSDTSIGDAINWEWMIECAMKETAELVIVTRDSDFGIVFENKSYVNDHLRQEFSERVSKKRKIILEHKLTDALKYFQVAVTKQETDAEADIIMPMFSMNVTTSMTSASDSSAQHSPFD